MCKKTKFRFGKIARVRSKRTGILTTDLLIAAVTLLSVITFFTTCSFQIRLVWKDIRHQRIAMEELNNQLESITLLSETEASKALNSLVPSTACENSLQDPKLTGALRKDLLGARVTLQLDWNKRHHGKPLEISGWIQNTGPEVNLQSQSTPTPSISTVQLVKMPQLPSQTVSFEKVAR